MGWCHEFGLQIRDGCGHPMHAGDTACSCPECGTVCGGRFAGCPDVWMQKLQPSPATVESTPVETLAPYNGTGRRRVSLRPTRRPSGAADRASASLGSEAGLTDVPEGSPPMGGSATARIPHAVADGSELAAIREELAEQRYLLDASRREILASVTRLVKAGQQQTVETIVGIMEADRRESLERIVQSRDAASEATSAGIVGAVERSIRQYAARRPAAELRTFLETDPAAGSMIAAIATRAAAQALRAEVASKLPPAVQRAANRSDKHIEELAERSDRRMEELVEGMEKPVSRAVRAAAKNAASPSEKPPAAIPRRAVKSRAGTAATEAKGSTDTARKQARGAAGATTRGEKAAGAPERRTSEIGRLRLRDGRA